MFPVATIGLPRRSSRLLQQKRTSTKIFCRRASSPSNNTAKKIEFVHTVQNLDNLERRGSSIVFLGGTIAGAAYCYYHKSTGSDGTDTNGATAGAVSCNFESTRSDGTDTHILLKEKEEEAAAAAGSMEQRRIIATSYKEVEEEDPYSFCQKCVAEAIGTGIIVSGGCGAVCAMKYAGAGLSLVGIAASFGISVAL